MSGILSAAKSWVISRENLVIWVLGLLMFVGVRFVYSFNGLYGQDSHEYLRYSLLLRESVLIGDLPAGFFWPVVYSLAGAILSLPDKEFTAAALQLISFLSWMGSCFLFRAILRRLYPQKWNSAGLYTLALFCPSAFFLRAAFVVMPDALAVFLVLATFYQLLLFSRNSGFINLYAAVIFGILAVFTRYPAALILMFPFLFSLKYLKRRGWILHVTLLAVLAVTLIYILLLLNHFGTSGSISHPVMQQWDAGNAFRSSFLTVDGNLRYYTVNFIYAMGSVFHPGYLLPGIVLVFFTKGNDFTKGWRLALTLSYLSYALLLMGYPMQNLRFILPAFPLAALLLFPAFFRLLSVVKQFRRWFVHAALAILIAQSVLCIYTLQPFIKASQLEKQISETLKRTLPADVAVYTFSIDPALRTYGVKNPVRCMWKQHYRTFEKGSVVLFRPQGFKRQWDGRNPMLNWESLTVAHPLFLLNEWPDGWKLYEIR